MWNIFKVKTPEQELQDKVTTQADSTVITTPLSQGVGGTFTLPSGAGVSITFPYMVPTMNTFNLGLSKEETEEMNRLKVEYTYEGKKAKILAFKQLAPEMRQFVISALTWQESLKQINSIAPAKSIRLIELENKNNAGQSLSTTWSTSATDMFGSVFATIYLPNSITAEDLKQAHLEVTLEEEVLNG